MLELKILVYWVPLKTVHLAKGICNSISFADNFLCLCLSEADSLDSLIVNALKSTSNKYNGIQPAIKAEVKQS